MSSQPVWGFACCWVEISSCRIAHSLLQPGEQRAIKQIWNEFLILTRLIVCTFNFPGVLLSEGEAGEWISENKTAKWRANFNFQKFKFAFLSWHCHTEVWIYPLKVKRGENRMLNHTGWPPLKMWRRSLCASNAKRMFPDSWWYMEQANEWMETDGAESEGERAQFIQF